MPRFSERARLIHTLTRYARLLHLSAAVDEGMEEEFDEAIDALVEVKSERYLSRARPEDEQRVRCPNQQYWNHFGWNDDDFKRAFRVSKAQFVFIAQLLATDEVFTRKPRG
ncbi:hypothetical protein OC834_006871, partial [Tilletia horrida]